MSNYKFVDMFYYPQTRDLNKFKVSNDTSEIFIKYTYSGHTVNLFIAKEKYTGEDYQHSLDHLVDALNPNQDELDYIELTEGQLCLELYLKALEIYRSKTNG